MSAPEKSNLDHLPSRRVFVKASTAAAAVGLFGAWGAKPAETAAAEEPPVVVEEGQVGTVRQAFDAAGRYDVRDLEADRSVGTVVIAE